MPNTILETLDELGALRNEATLELVGLSALVQQIQDSGQAHIAEMKISSVLSAVERYANSVETLRRALAVVDEVWEMDVIDGAEDDVVQPKFVNVIWRTQRDAILRKHGFEK